MLGVVMIGTVMSALDSSIVNVTLPNMMASFGASVDDIEWVVTGYMLGFSTFMPLTAWLRDKLGYRTLYLASLTVFTVGSVLCGLAPNLPTLVVARVIQAIGGGAITPTGMAMIAEVFPPKERGRALGLWGVGVIVGPALGPTIGGYLTAAFGWRSIFNINLPIGLLGLFAAARILRHDKPGAGVARKFDLPGFLLLSTFLVSALLALSNGNHLGWGSRYVVTCALIASVSLVLFIGVEQMVEEGILDLELFKNSQFSVAIAVTAARSVALYGGTFLLPLFLRNYMDRSEIATGLLLLPGALVIGMVMPFSARLAERFGPRATTIAGLALTAWFMWSYRTVDITTSTWDVLYPTLIRGLGLGLLVTPVMTAAMNAVPTTKAGMASSMLSLVQQVAGSIGIAMLASVLGRRMTFHLAVVGQGLDGAGASFQATVRTVSASALELGMAPADAALTARSLVARHIAESAGVLAFNDAFLVGAAVVVCGVLPALFLSSTPPVRRGPPPQPHESLE
ncbi:MAG: DHA2 family efflux MFS transporter permease subunit [Archangium sp.]|nr:DHA2 family efflux MFS transporter permease subunit [Archangium sp.]